MTLIDRRAFHHRRGWERRSMLLVQRGKADMPDLAPLLFALAAGTMSASYAILIRLGSGSINPALGALIISGVALPFTAIVFTILRVWHPGTMITPKGVSLMMLAGIAAASTTVFGLLAYARGFKLSSSPLITATQMSVVLLVGFVFLKEPFTIGRLLALILIALGIWALQRQGV
jgi:uncharacterized membrane protein